MLIPQNLPSHAVTTTLIPRIVGTTGKCCDERSNYEGDSNIVIFTFTESCWSIELAKDGLLLTYLCDRVDAETNEQAFALPFEFLQDCSIGTGVVDLQSIVESGENCITAKWSDGLVRCERTYATQDPPKYHLVSDLAWHTVDERLVRVSATENDRGELAPNHRVSSCPIEPVARVPH